MSRHVFLIAGEPSGDRLGASLMEGLRQLDPQIRFSGIGGPLMEAQGLESLFPMSDLSVMGIAEVLPRLRRLFRRRDEAAAAALERGVDALITIDSPDFCLRVARKVKAARPGLPVIHYVAPSVWAWRPGRARRMAAHVDHVLTLLPFEPPYMEAAGMSADFVGHPVAAEPIPDAAERAAFRAELGLAEDERVVTVLPGSRRGEVERLAPVFGAAVVQVAGRVERLRVIVPASASVAELVTREVAGWAVPALVLDPRGMAAERAEARKHLAFAISDAALAASGTVALELAATGTPMVIGYRMAPLSSWIIRRMIRVRHVSLVNLLNDAAVVPEHLQEYCTADALAGDLVSLLTDDAARARQREAAARAMEMLGRGGEPPGLSAARSVIAAMDRLSGK